MLTGKAAQETAAPGGIGEVMTNLLNTVVMNPVEALAEGQYLSILFWSILLGLALKSIAADTSKTFLNDISDGMSTLVRWIINLAPFGIMGLTYSMVSENGLGVFQTYGSLLLVLVGSMLTVALIVDPFIAFLFLHRNPYPLVLRCLKKVVSWLSLREVQLPIFPSIWNCAKNYYWMKKCIRSLFHWDQRSIWMGPPSRSPSLLWQHVIQLEFMWILPQPWF